MNLIRRNNISIKGKGSQPIMFAHGFGCGQDMWRYVHPSFEESYKIILFDHVGSGNSDLSAYDTEKYNSLNGYADDVVEIVKSLNLKDVIFVGHSVSAMIGIIASQKAPELFKSLILVGPSPCYINDGEYVGGFTKIQIDELLESLDNNHLGWSVTMAPVIMQNLDRKELSEELSNSFCRTNPEIAKHFARTTFLSDERNIVSEVKTPTLILQCSDDIIAPQEVGEYMHRLIKGSKLVVMKATGHCPNLSAPEETVMEILQFLS